MRAFYFLTKSEQGGAQTVVYELLREHKKRGDEAIVMANGNGWLMQETKALGFHYIENQHMRKSYNPFSVLRAALLYRKAVRETVPDLVSCHSSFSGIIGRVFKWGSIPVVYTTHGWGFAYGSKLFFWPGLIAEKIAAWRGDAIICVSESDRTIARQYRIAPERELFLIHNGAAVPAGDGDVSEKNTIAFLGRFSWPKRQDILLDAYAMLPNELRKSAGLLFIGSGPEENDMRRKVGKLRLQESVQFAGNQSRDAALTLLSKASVMVLVSHSEGFPMSVIEALQLGVPVIANDVGGIGEMVDDTVGRLLPSAPDAQFLADALTETLSNPQMLKSLSRAATERGTQFSAKHMSDQTILLYTSLINH